LQNPNATDFSWNVRVRAAGEEAATVFARKHHFTVGATVQFDEECPQISALEYVLGALGADLINGLRRLAGKRRLSIDHLEATVEGKLNNPLTYLGVIGEEGHPGLDRVRIKVYASTLHTGEEFEAVWKEMLGKSPLLRAFREALDFDLSYKLVF